MDINYVYAKDVTYHPRGEQLMGNNVNIPEMLQIISSATTGMIGKDIVLDGFDVKFIINSGDSIDFTVEPGKVIIDETYITMDTDTTVSAINIADLELEPEGHVVVNLRYNTYIVEKPETHDQMKICVNFVTERGFTHLDWDKNKDLIVLEIYKYTLDQSGKITSLTSLNKDFISIHSKTYYRKGHSLTNIHIKSYIDAYLRLKNIIPGTQDLTFDNDVTIGDDLRVINDAIIDGEIRGNSSGTIKDDLNVGGAIIVGQHYPERVITLLNDVIYFGASWLDLNKKITTPPKEGKTGLRASKASEKPALFYFDYGLNCWVADVGDGVPWYVGGQPPVADIRRFLYTSPTPKRKHIIDHNLYTNYPMIITYAKEDWQFAFWKSIYPTITIYDRNTVIVEFENQEFLKCIIFDVVGDYKFKSGVNKFTYESSDIGREFNIRHNLDTITPFVDLYTKELDGTWVKIIADMEITGNDTIKVTFEEAGYLKAIIYDVHVEE